MAKSYRQAFGRWGEDRALDFLAAQGYALVGRNVRTPYGEIDLILRQDGGQGGGVLVFVEVKTRSSDAFGLPEEAVDRRKQEHLLAAAQSYLQERPELEGSWRIDVVAVCRAAGGGPPEITHFENALA